MSHPRLSTEALQYYLGGQALIYARLADPKVVGIKGISAIERDGQCGVHIDAAWAARDAGDRLVAIDMPTVDMCEAKPDVDYNDTHMVVCFPQIAEELRLAAPDAKLFCNPAAIVAAEEAA